MKSESRKAQFLTSLKAVGCELDNLSQLSENKELPKKLLKFVSGGKTGFSRQKTKGEFKRVDFYRAMHH